MSVRRIVGNELLRAGEVASEPAGPRDADSLRPAMALRITATVFVLGALAMWLVVPVGNPCPDLGKLPPGSTSSSSPSFSPPLTRMCTYTTADGTQARSRYVPWVWWLALALVAVAAGAPAGFAGPREPRPERARRDRGS